jgi:hypothetical protein
MQDQYTGQTRIYLEVRHYYFIFRVLDLHCRLSLIHFDIYNPPEKLFIKEAIQDPD